MRPFLLASLILLLFLALGRLPLSRTAAEPDPRGHASGETAGDGGPYAGGEEKPLSYYRGLGSLAPSDLGRPPGETTPRSASGEAEDGRGGARSRAGYPYVELANGDLKYFPYLARLKRSVELEWRYPPEARVEGRWGDVTLLVTLSRAGVVEGVDVLESSAYADLDAEAVRAVRDAAPFGEMPDDWGVRGLKVRMRFSYVLENWWEEGTPRASGQERSSEPSFEQLRLEILSPLVKHAVLSSVSLGGR